MLSFLVFKKERIGKKGALYMALSMLKIKRPFDLLRNWDAYVATVNHLFSEPEEEPVWVPAVDVGEKDGKFLITADIPGVKEEDIRVVFTKGRLIIRGRRKREDGREAQQRHMSERYYGRFERIIEIGAGVKESEITQEYKDGILTITIPITAFTLHDVRAA